MKLYVPVDNTYIQVVDSVTKTLWECVFKISVSVFLCF